MDRNPTPDMSEYAGVLDRRLEALLIDGLLVVLTLGVLGYLGGTLLVGGAVGGVGGALVGIQFVAPFALIGYQTAMEGYYGRTVGKSLRNIVVVDEDGSSVGWGGAVVRNLLRIVDALPAFYVVGVVVAYLTDDHQRLGDLAGSTVVVHTAD
ncbi:MAG: RDD family protein [Halopenitus sp.]